MACKICGSNVKNPDSPGHLNSKKHLQAISKEEYRSLQPHRAEKIKNLEDRIAILESQIITILSKLNEKDPQKEIAPSKSKLSITQSTNTAIQQAILKILRSNKSVELDHLERQLPFFQWDKIELVLRNLLDEGKVIGGDAKSRRKLYSRYGKISMK